LNGEHIRGLDPAVLAREVVEFHRSRGKEYDLARVLPLIPLVRERLKTLLDFEPWTDFFFAKEVTVTKELFATSVKKLALAEQIETLQLARAQVAAAPVLDSANVEAPLKDVATAKGWKVGDLFMCLRLAITGKAATPPLVESMAILGKDACVARIDAAMATLAAN
jgi:glutamyl-tRNA synthetase